MLEKLITTIVRIIEKLKENNKIKKHKILSRTQ